MAVYRTWTVRPVMSDPGLRASSRTSRSQQSVADTDRNARTIPVRIREEEGAWVVEADAPGVLADAIGIEFFQERLTIRYGRNAPDGDEAKFDDRTYGAFERIIRIAGEIRADAIAAKLEHGVLRLEIPKSDADQPRTIPVAQG